MTNPRLIITAVILENRTQAEVARAYGVSPGWVSKLLTRYREEGEAAFTPRSRRPRNNPHAIPPDIVQLVLDTREQLTARGLDAGAETIAWHLKQAGASPMPSRATIHRILTRHAQVSPQPRKRPKSSWTRFEADQPNECWQSDFTHYPLTDGTDAEILTWLDDHSRYALHISAHAPVTAKIVLTTFIQTCDQHGRPASTLTDNGMVYTVRLAGRGRTGGRTALERHLAITGITQKNSRPNHPTTCGKVEEYNQHRPHRALSGRTPAAAYTTRPKASPAATTTPHERVRHDKIDTAGKVTLRIAGQLHKIAVGRTHARTPVIMLVQNHHVRIAHATTGELLRELTIDPTRRYQPLNPQKNPEPGARGFPMS